MEGSSKYSLNSHDIKKIVVGAGIALAGAFLTYITSIITQIDFKEWTPVVTAGCAILINTLRKFLTSYEQKFEQQSVTVTVTKTVDPEPEKTVLS